MAFAGLVCLAVPAAGDDDARAERLFRTAKCVLCHSVNEHSKRPGALDDVGSRLTADEIRAWLTDPVRMRAKTKATRTPAMPVPKLTKAEVDTLVAYLETLTGLRKQR